MSKKTYSLERADKITVKLDLKCPGERYEISHVLTPLTEAEQQEKWVLCTARNGAKDDSEKLRWEARIVEMQKRLWLEHVVSIEGYGIKPGEDWKKTIPQDHILYVMDQVCSLPGILGEGTRVIVAIQGSDN